jgi:hypothetical protein
MNEFGLFLQKVTKSTEGLRVCLGFGLANCFFGNRAVNEGLEHPSFPSFPSLPSVQIFDAKYRNGHCGFQDGIGAAREGAAGGWGLGSGAD